MCYDDSVYRYAGRHYLSYDVGFYRSKKAQAKYFKQTSNALDNIDKYLKAQNVQIKCSDALKKLDCPTEEYEYLKAAYQMCSQEF